jgi:proliferating cell nuclear antigen
LIDPDSIRDGTNIDETTWGEAADVELPAAAFDHAIDLAGMVADHVSLEADPDRDAPVVVTADGDTDDVRVAFEDSLLPGSAVEEAATGLYSEDYLSDLFGVVPGDAEVRLRFGDEFPLRLDYGHQNGAAEVAMVLAPRIVSS